MNMTHKTVTKCNQALTFVLLMLATVAAAASGGQFDVSGTGSINWIPDGDTVLVRVDDRAVFNNLRSWAINEQSNRQRDLQVAKRFDSQRQTMLIRIAGINTDESVHPDPSRNTSEGIRASDFAKRTFSGSITFRCSDIGYYGRPICAVSGNFGDWGDRVIRAGFSDYITKYGNHPFYHQEYLQAERNR